MDDMDNLLPPGIARSMSQRSNVSALSNKSDDHDWHGDEKVSGGEIGVARSGSTGGQWGDGRGYGGVGDVSPLSPLPPVAKRDGEGDLFVDGVGFSIVPKSTRPKRAVLGGETIQKEMEKEKIFELNI